jgi:UDP-GlcNAc3NAcA epimerase
MRKLVSIVGARPQFIKLGPFSKEIRKYFKEIIIHTGQHFDQNMSNLFFEELKIPKPDHVLNVQGGSHAIQTAGMLVEIEKILISENPEFVVVFGDTNSTLAGALAASKLNIPLIHIEAGLRSYNMEMPEEMNRKITDHISKYLFVPTITGLRNLENEGLLNSSYLTGDIMTDSLKEALALNKGRSVQSTNHILLTLHRPYNVDDPKKLENILNQLKKLDKTIIFPIHPRTRKSLGNPLGEFGSKINFIEPLGYLDFVALMESCSLIITDSGGIQKESYILKKPCVTLRTETEWTETVEAGWNLLIDPDEPFLCSKIMTFSPPATYHDIFGENVAQKMVSLVKDF